MKMTKCRERMSEGVSRPAFDRYHSNEDMVALMRDLVRAYPHLSSLYSIGKSHENRDLWMLEITDRETGPGQDKPGYYIDGNHHAVEVTGAAVCLYTAWYLLSSFGVDRNVTQLLGNTVFYILPRVSPDGVEMFLTTPHSLRSSTRPYPEPEPEPGLHPEDVDGDGRILEMRIEDPHGEWKISDRDQRLMVRRLPDDYGGCYYRRYPEGVLHGWDGGEIKIARPRWGLDLNRNYPALWDVEKKDSAGPFPLSEPETRAVADFISAHHNIAGAMSYHTTGGFILRPSCHRPDRDLPETDVLAMKAIGWRGEEITGYRCVSTYEEFTAGRALGGVFMDWLYEHQGLIAYSTELWNASARAGIERRSRALSPAEEEEDGLKLLTWNDRDLGGEGFVPWYSHQHPQLGKVELGGWDYKFTLWNPPAGLLESECHKNALFTLAHAASLPRLGVTATEVISLGDSVYRLRITVKNLGYLPTWVSEPGRKLAWASPPVAVLDLPQKASLIHGQKREDVSHLSGRAGANPRAQGGPGREKTLTWVIHAPGQARSVSVKVEGARVGRLSLTVDLMEAVT